MLQLPIFDCDVRANQVVKTLKLTDSPSRARASIPHESLLATQGMADFALFYEMRWKLSAYDGGSYDDGIPWRALPAH